MTDLKFERVLGEGDEPQDDKPIEGVDVLLKLLEVLSELGAEIAALRRECRETALSTKHSLERLELTYDDPED